MNLRFPIVMLAALALAPLASAQQAARPETGPAAERGQAVEGVAVLVNDEVISYSDVRNRTRFILLSLGNRQPDEETLLQAQQRAIESLIEDKVKFQKFQELSKDRTIPDEEVTQRLEGLARQNRVSLDQFLGNLAARGVQPQTLREQIRADIAWTAIVRGRFSQQVRVSDLRIMEFQNRIRESLNRPQYRIAEIFLYAPDVASQENALARAETLKRQIEQGAPFEAVAQQFSAAPSASAGGDLDWLTPGDMRPEILGAVEKQTEFPAILPPIATEGGVYLIAALGKRDPADPQAVALDLIQVTATGEDVEARLGRVKAGATECAKVADLVKAENATATDLPNMAMQDLGPGYQQALLPLQPNQATDILDIEGTKAIVFVCDKRTGTILPDRDDIRARLFDQEISMLADRYLRDLKREATIIRR